jgi:peptidyl-dipeptidase Dcp
MTSTRLLLTAVTGLALAGCATATQPAAPPAVGGAPTVSVQLSASNPFAAASTLQYQAPPFDRIKDADYQPAMEAGMRQQIAEMEAIANQSAAPTFDNTIVPMERSGALLTRVAKVFNGVTGANTDDTLQHIQEVVAPKLAAHSDAIYLNGALFQRVKTIYDRRDALGFTPEQKFLVELYY